MRLIVQEVSRITLGKLDCNILVLYLFFQHKSFLILTLLNLYKLSKCFNEFTFKFNTFLYI